MGGAGMLSAGFVLPVIGKWYDDGISAGIPEGTTIDALKAAEAGTPQAAEWATIQADAGLHALGQVAYLPVGLTVIFLALLLATPRNGKSVEAAA
jgi:hypothetical protein